MSDTNKFKKTKELSLLFFKLGLISFGGSAVHIAMMEEEVVRKRNWLTREEFLDLLGATNLIPGPNSTELAIHIGHRRAGWAGLIAAGTCFIVPAAAIVLLIAWFYTKYQSLPQTGWILYGVKPVVIAVVFQALWGLTKSAVKNLYLGLLAVAVIAANLLGANELVLLFASGFLVMAIARPFMAFVVAPATAAAANGFAAFNFNTLFLIFLKIGAILFGSGYVLIAFLEADFVHRLHWLTESQLIDAIAVGQITPGPLFTTATFVGYLLGGNFGAFLATLGIFLPAFFFVAISGPLVPKMRASKTAGAFLDGINAASLALMASATLQLGRSSLVDIPTIAIAIVTAVLLIRFKLNSAWLVILGGAAGAAIHFLG